MKHYRAIVFVAAVPAFLRKDTSAESFIGHGSTPEDAMLSAACSACWISEHKYLRQGTTWQPCTGTVYINGAACGAVFDITAEWDKGIKEAEEFAQAEANESKLERESTAAEHMAATR